MVWLSSGAICPGSVGYAFVQSGGFAQVIVILLLLTSMYGWTLMVDKFRQLLKARDGNRSFQGIFNGRKALTEVFLNAAKQRGPLAIVYRAGMDEVLRILDADEIVYEKYCRERRLPRGLTPSERDRVREVMDRMVMRQIDHFQKRLGTLGTIVSVSPFLGLLGTVWGVMMAFVAMAQAGRPDISAMAPGISGALLTTVVGLLVAIPAVVGYNLINSRVKELTAEMDELVDDMVDAMRTEAA